MVPLTLTLLVVLSGTLLTITGETTVPATLDAWQYSCESEVAECPSGYVIQVEKMYRYSKSLQGCPTTFPNTSDPCYDEPSAVLVTIQRQTCRGKRSCEIFSMSGYRGSCDITTFGVLLFKCEFVGFPLHPETTPEPPPTTTTPAPIVRSYCQPANLTCAEGEVIIVEEVFYGAKVTSCNATTEDCCTFNAADCYRNVSRGLFVIQSLACANQTQCTSVDLSGNSVLCNGQTYTTSYGFVRYHCKSVPSTSTSSSSALPTSTSATRRTSPATTSSVLTTKSTRKPSTSTTSSVRATTLSAANSSRLTSASRVVTVGPSTRKSSPATTSSVLTTKSTRNPSTSTTSSVRATTLSAANSSRLTSASGVVTVGPSTRKSSPATTPQTPNGNDHRANLERAFLLQNLANGHSRYGILSFLLHLAQDLV